MLPGERITSVNQDITFLNIRKYYEVLQPMLDFTLKISQNNQALEFSVYSKICNYVTSDTECDLE